MKSKLFIITTIICIIFSLIFVVFASEILINNHIKIYIDNEKFTKETLIYKDRLYAPLREMYSENGYEVKWHPENSTVEISKNGLNGFVEKNVPYEWQHQQDKTYNLDNYYEVYVDTDGNIETREYTHENIKISTPNDITYIIEDNGEWGGKLFYRDSYSNETPFVQLLDKNILDVCNIQSKDFAIAYDINLYYPIYTEIYEIVCNQGYNFRKCSTVQTDIKIDGIPYATTNYKNALIIVTSKGIYQINYKKGVDTLYDNAFWYVPEEDFTFLHPTSIVVKDDIAYIGMRGGITTVDLITNEIQWFEKIG